ncbi:MAG: hypothetical protein IJ740_04555 [Ruminococcus sp.]|nr:hypothetical protein [Ruminococcus sp.]
MINDRYELPIKAGAMALWAGCVTGLYYLSERFPNPIGARVFAFMLIDPALILCASFYLARAFGSKWYYKAAFIVLSAVMYFLTPLKNVTPNTIIVAAICVIFGSGIGDVFSGRDKEAEAEDEKYTPILGDDSDSKDKKGKKKKK